MEKTRSSLKDVKSESKETGSLFASRLTTKWLGKKILFYRELTSTQDEAKRLAPEAPQGLVIWTDRQTKGRGRLARTWHSPRGAGLYFSLILKEPLARPLPLYSLATAVGVAEALEEEIGVPFSLKWPNDLLLNGRKVGGILVEGVLTALIIGIGLNVGLCREDMPPEIREKATSILEETGLSPSRARLLRTILKGLEGIYEELLAKGFEGIRSRWQERDVTFLTRVVLKRADQVITGLALGPAPDGSLILKTSSGHLRVSSGEILLWEIPGWESRAA